jgi:hypothetical protein
MLSWSSYIVYQSWVSIYQQIDNKKNSKDI